mgnify:CR=1 FL=1
MNDFFLNILAFSGILTFGIIHGANDLLLIKEVSENYNFKLQFLYYVIMVGGFFLFFYNIPILALITFVLLSSYHFGEHQWTLFERIEDDFNEIWKHSEPPIVVPQSKFPSLLILSAQASFCPLFSDTSRLLLRELPANKKELF